MIINKILSMAFSCMVLHVSSPLCEFVFYLLFLVAIAVFMLFMLLYYILFIPGSMLPIIIFVSLLFPVVHYKDDLVLFSS